MLKSLLLALVIFTQGPKPEAQPPKPPETGIIAGIVVGDPEQKLVHPVRVILLSAHYANLWDTDVQQRLDVYWERFKPAFAIQKEFFFEVSRRAQKEAADAIVFRMRRDPSAAVSEYVKEASPTGTFEFMNIPLGEYKILAVGRVGGEEVIWQDSIYVGSPIPQFVELKNRAP
jgi:hypothetical protein